MREAGNENVQVRFVSNEYKGNNMGQGIKTL
jgi:hypothetical protein